jgi:hypothetical protein
MKNSMKDLIERLKQEREQNPFRTDFEDLETIRNAEAIERQEQRRRRY